MSPHAVPRPQPRPVTDLQVLAALGVAVVVVTFGGLLSEGLLLPAAGVLGAGLLVALVVAVRALRRQVAADIAAGAPTPPPDWTVAELKALHVPAPEFAGHIEVDLKAGRAVVIRAAVSLELPVEAQAKDAAAHPGPPVDEDAATRWAHLAEAIEREHRAELEQIDRLLAGVA